MDDHTFERALFVVSSIALAQGVGLVEAQPGRVVAVQLVVGAGLVGDDVHLYPAAHDLGEHLRRIAQQPDAQRLALVLRCLAPLQRLIQAGGRFVEVGRLQPALDAVRVDLDDQPHALVEGDRQRLGAAHAPQPRRQRQRARQRAAEVALGAGRQRLVGALQDALGADIDPAAGGHLAVHRQPHPLVLAEVLPVRPVRHDQAVGDQHARCPFVGAEHAHRLARLHQQSLVTAQLAQRRENAVETRPVARGAARAAVDDQLGGLLRHVRIQVVLDHAVGGFLHPAPAAELQARRRMDDAGFAQVMFRAHALILARERHPRRAQPGAYLTAARAALLADVACVGIAEVAGTRRIGRAHPIGMLVAVKHIADRHGLAAALAMLHEHVIPG